MSGLVRSFAFLQIATLFLLFAMTSTSLGQASALGESSRALYRGDYAKASALAAAHLRKSPSDVPVRVVLARAEIAQAEFTKAFEDLRKALAFDPKNIDALFYLSLLAKEFSQKENERFFSLAPDSDRAHQLLGEAALTASNQSQAEEEFLKALKGNPYSVIVLTELAELKRSQFKFDEAIGYYLQAERLDPLDYEIAYRLGSCYSSKQEFSEAVEWFEKAVALAPNSAVSQFALGNALFQNNQFEAAITKLKASVQIDPGMTQAYYLLGRAYSNLGRDEEAKAIFQKVNELYRAEMHTEVKREGTPPKQR